MRIIGLIGLTLFALTGVALAQPANDNFSAAFTITGSQGTVTGTNDAATTETDEPVHANRAGGQSIWYQWVSASDTCVEFSTADSDFDTILSIYTGSSLDTLTTVAESDDYDTTQTSLVTFSALNGTVYNIAVDGGGTSTGSVILNWREYIPGLPAEPLPFDGETTVSTIAILDWQDTTDTLEYEVLLNNSSLGTTSLSEFPLTPPLPPQLYEWQVVARNGCSETTGPLWTFITCDAPALPMISSPVDGETTSCALQFFDWADDTNTSSYDIYIDDVFVGNTTVSEWNNSVTLADGSHTWQLVAHNECYVTTGTTSTFCLVEAPASLLTPANNSLTSCGAVLLDWDDACGAVEYNVYLDGLLAAKVTSSEYTTSSAAGPHTWQIESVGTCGNAPSDVWTFCVLSEASVPLPANGESTSTLSYLDWEDVCGAETYELYVDSTITSILVESRFDLLSVLSGGSHSWQVVTNGECGVTTSPLWNFCIQDIPTSPIPSIGETTAPVSILEWDDATSATSYEVFLDGINVGTTTSNSLELSTPAGPGSHEWQVVTVGPCGNISGDLWTFDVCTPLTAATNPAPFNGESTNSLVGILDWDDVVGALEYDVYFDGILQGRVSVSEFVIGFTLTDGTHTWRVDPVTPCEVFTGDEWSFSVCTVAQLPAVLAPQDGTTTSPSVAFYWTQSASASSYDVYIDGSLVAGGVTSTSFVPPVALSEGPHTWRVDATARCGTETGTTINFCVMNVPVGGTPHQDIFCSAPETLDWDDLPGATQYNVILDGIVVDTVPDSFWVINQPLSMGYHTWQVVAYGSCGSIASSEWIFQLSSQREASTEAVHTNGHVYAMAAIGKTLYIGGNFTQVMLPNGMSSVQRTNLAAIDLTTGRATDWNPSANGLVKTVVTDGTTVFVGGDFTTVDNLPRARLAEIDLTGNPTAFAPTFDGTVNTIALDAANIYVGGAFTKINGTDCQYLGSIARSGTLNPWIHTPDYHVEVMKFDNTLLYIGGSFTTIGFVSRTGLAAIDTSSNALINWAPQVDLYVYSMAFSDQNTIYVGGLFNTIGGQLRRNIAEIDLSSALVTGWDPFATGAVLALEVHNDIVYAGGLFAAIGGEARHYLAAIDEGTGTNISCNFLLDNYVRALFVDNDGIAAGGEFSFVGSNSLRGFAYFGDVEFVPLNSAEDWSLFQ